MVQSNDSLKRIFRGATRLSFSLFCFAMLATLNMDRVHGETGSASEIRAEAKQALDKTIAGLHTPILGRPKNGDFYPVVSVIESYDFKTIKLLRGDPRDPKAKHYEIEIEFKVVGDWSAEIGKETYHPEKRVDRVKVVLGKSGSSSAWMKKLSHPYVKASAVGRWVSSQDPNLKDHSP